MRTRVHLVNFFSFVNSLNLLHTVIWGRRFRFGMTCRAGRCSIVRHIVGFRLDGFGCRLWLRGLWGGLLRGGVDLNHLDNYMRVFG